MWLADVILDTPSWPDIQALGYTAPSPFLKAAVSTQGGWGYCLNETKMSQLSEGGVLHSVHR